MRHVQRPPEPESLRSQKTQDERKAALAFYENWDGQQKFDKFSAYKGADVKAAMEEAFHFKCAYCESSYSATQPLAVEHYRPKGLVTIDGVRTPPGYYWLASDWDNLLPSCTDCNSPRGQELPTGFATAGKFNAFPIASEAKRAVQPGSERLEGRLILHPYLDHPEKHLRLVWNYADPKDVGNGRVEGRTPAGRVSRKGEETIAVCALLRRGLVAARRNQLLNLLAHLHGVEDALANVARDPANPVFLEQYEARLAEVGRYIADEAPYSVLAKQMVNAYYARLFPGGSDDR